MNIALYPRVSTQEQAINGHSIDEQIERMRKYCEAMGWTIYKTYTDAGYSGGNMDRPGLQSMIRDIEKGKIDKVLVYKLDRLSRSQLDTLYLIEKVFIANGTDFVSMSESFDTSTPFGRAVIGILAVFAQLEREQIKERMAMGRFARAKQGKFGGSDKVPIGYDYIDGELITNEYERMQIIRLFELYEAGASPYKIAEAMTEAGFKHKYGKWSERRVREILGKKTYLGYTFFKGEWYQGDHEPFISEELFEKVQAIRSQKSEEHLKYNRRSGKATTYLGGYIYCGNCGGKYSKHTGRVKRKDGSYITNSYYSCNSRTKRTKHLIKDPTCKNKNWRVDALDNLVFEEIKKLAVDPEYFEKVKAGNPADERPALIKKELEKIEDQISKLLDLYTTADMPKEILQDRLHGLNDNKGKLEQELHAIEKEEAEKLSQADALKLTESFSEILSRGDYDEIRQVIGALIGKIVINGEDITIHWNFS